MQVLLDPPFLPIPNSLMYGVCIIIWQELPKYIIRIFVCYTIKEDENMKGINQSTYAQTDTAYHNMKASETALKTSETDGKSEVKGANTYGNPKLSESGLAYYNSLKKKYGNLNFILVSSDKKQEAEAVKGSFANVGKFTVLIDTDKIEKMATDSSYRKQIEGTIQSATLKMAQMSSDLNASTRSVTAFGMSINKNGVTSFFAVIDKSLVAQRERIAKKAKDNKDTKKTEAKKAEQKKAEELLAEKRKTTVEDENTVTFTANTPEELYKQIQDYEMLFGDTMYTEEEEALGKSIDYFL